MPQAVACSLGHIEVRHNLKNKTASGHNMTGEMVPHTFACTLLSVASQDKSCIMGQVGGHVMTDYD